MAYYVYILTDQLNRTLYIGVTNNLVRRVAEHQAKSVEGFTKRYNLDKLVYYESFSNIQAAITREKELKKWRREKKNKLVESKNPLWREIRIEDMI